MSEKPYSAIIPAPFQPVYDNYCHAPAVRVGNDLHLSGLIGFNADGSVPEDFSTQVSNIFDYMALILAEAGASLANVYSVVSYHVGDIKEQMPHFIAIQAARLGKPYAAWTAMGTTGLALPGALVEVTAIARISD